MTVEIRHGYKWDGVTWKGGSLNHKKWSRSNKASGKSRKVGVQYYVPKGQKRPRGVHLEAFSLKKPVPYLTPQARRKPRWEDNE